MSLTLTFRHGDRTREQECEQLREAFAGQLERWTEHARSTSEPLVDDAPLTDIVERDDTHAGRVGPPGVRRDDIEPEADESSPGVDMSLIDWAAAWNPAPDHRPCRVWLPSSPAADDAPAARPERPRHPIVLTLSNADANGLPCRLPGLLAQTDVRPGDAVTVDLTSAASVHLSGLELLLTVLWRRVGPSGDVKLVGGAPGLHAEIGSLGMTSRAGRAAVYGPLPAAPVPPSQARTPATSSRPSAPELGVPAPRRRSDARSAPDAPGGPGWFWQAR